MKNSLPEGGHGLSTTALETPVLPEYQDAIQYLPQAIHITIRIYLFCSTKYPIPC